MPKKYLVCTKIYYEIEVSGEATLRYDNPDGEAISALEDIHNHELYWLNDYELSIELRLMGHDFLKSAKYVGREYETCKEIKEE